MWDLLYKKMYSINNLELAWMRIKTAQNISYKNYYRDLFFGYELAVDKNLGSLSDRLKGGAFSPSEILRFYLPKASGLHRPITFLHLDDLIVYQAFANIVAEKFSDQRREVEYINVFSNVLNRNIDKPIFLYKKWQEGYKRFLSKISYYFKNNNPWVAHFDLAAYYDTIDHYVLCNQISRNSYKSFTEFISNCLETWSSHHKSKKLHHAIPQGPISSSLIGEIYLLPIDKTLNKNKVKYVRYVDDIKIFGENREEVLYGIILLEKECKERGLIPQSKKYEIKKAYSIEEAIGKFPSLKVEEKNLIFTNEDETYNIFIKAFEESSFDISRVKYILKVSLKNDKILEVVLNNLNKHPELCDEFCEFLLNYSADEKIGKQIYYEALSKPSPYEYVQGKYWELLSEFQLDDFDKHDFIQEAMRRLKANRNNFCLKLGLYKFLCSTKNRLVLNWLNKESSSLVQSFVIPFIPEVCTISSNYNELIKTCFRRSNYEPALAIIKNMVSCNDKSLIKNLPEPLHDNSGVIRNTLGKSERVDSIGQIIKGRYQIDYNKWRVFLGTDYEHANNVLFLADKAFYIDKNSWVNYTDTFNDIVIRKFIELLRQVSPTVNWPKIIGGDGKNIDFGKLMDINNQLSVNYPQIINGLREFHERRSKTPASHAYEKNTLKQTKFVTRKEQRELFSKVKFSYTELINELNKLI